MPRRKSRTQSKGHHELPSHKRDWLLVSVAVIVMIIFFILVFSRFAY